MTSNKRADKQISNLFKRNLMPIAEHFERTGTPALDSDPDPGLDSYYATPATRTMSKADFEWGGVPGVDQLEAALRELWADEACPGFATLAVRIATLARLVKANDEQSSELSQFVYVMY